jgi:uncharacterized protein YajQ (UPF0234 family)
MAGTFSFDIVSDFDRQELVNAVDQTTRDVRTRFDLKDTKSEIKLDEKTLLLTSNSEYALSQIRDILESKAFRRGLSLKIFDYGEPEEAGGMTYRQTVTLRKGIPEDLARKLGKQIRDNIPKVQVQVQGDALRVMAKAKDDLQAVIKYLRDHEADYPVPLQYTNYR